jgi:hypothetical protein
MRKLRLIAASLIANIFYFALVAATPADATVHITIDLSSQSMAVDSRSGRYAFPISSARAGYTTPRGSYRAQRLVRMHYSKKYHNSPMPHSIFFRGGYAIHGTGAVSQLGRPASHGCIRLAPRDAALLYGLVQEEGARISITGLPPTNRFALIRNTKRARVAVAREHRHASAFAFAPGYQSRVAPPLHRWLIWPTR